MGLRFRKSITLCKGVRLNVGKNGVSISSGIPGFRKTIHSSGRVTTSMGIPGTGIYYVDTKNPKKKKEENKGGGFLSELFGNTEKNSRTIPDNTRTYTKDAYRESNKQKVYNTESIYGQIEDKENLDSVETVNEGTPAILNEGTSIQLDTVVRPIVEDAQKETVSHADIIKEKRPEKITNATIKAIFENCDVAIDWADVISNLTPISDDVNADTWEYLHKKAVKVFEGDIDTYLEIISKVNPYDDLLDYAKDFEFGTDNPAVMEVEFSVIDENTENLSKIEFEDYYSAIAIRTARDTFAILPVEDVIVHVMYNGDELITASFDRSRFHELDFVGKDPSDLIYNTLK